jgi:integrase
MRAGIAMSRRKTRSRTGRIFSRLPSGNSVALEFGTNGKVNEMPCHHKLEAYLDAYIEAAGIEDDRKGPLFRSALGKTKILSVRPLSRTDVWYMIRRRAEDMGLETTIGCHTFRATGITDYLTNGGRIEIAQRMAEHANATGLYDRRNDDISVSEVERVGI